MAGWCEQRGVELCPHIKTTMTRPIVERQLAAGAWGVTVATVRQAGVALGWGLRRILIANEVVTPRPGHHPALARRDRRSGAVLPGRLRGRATRCRHSDGRRPAAATRPRRRRNFRRPHRNPRTNGRPETR